MKRIIVFSSIACVMVLGGACRRTDTSRSSASLKDSEVLQSRMTRLNESLARADSGDAGNQPIARWLLPAELAEISGLALTPDGRLFAHADETARITEIDYRRGTIKKHFFAGEAGLHGDFEGMTYANERFYMLASNGVLYEFPEGGQGERVDCTVYDTKLGKECEFEGVTYDEKADAMVLACKNAGETHKKGMLVLYRYRLAGAEMSEIAVPQSRLIGRNRWKELRPTDITVDPSNGNYVMVSAQEKALVALTPEGDTVLATPLNGQHPQAEGIAITRDHILIVSDESTNSAASITLYRWP